MAKKTSHEELTQRVRALEAELDQLRYQKCQQNNDWSRVSDLTFHDSPSWMKIIFNAINEAVYVVTPDRKIINTNKAAEEMFGYTRDELVGKYTKILHVDQESYDKFGEKIKTAFSRGTTAHFTFKAKRKNGEVFDTEHSVSLVLDADGETQGIVSIVRDITERLMSKKALTEANIKFRLITDTIRDIFWISTRGVGKMIYISPAYEVIWGKTMEDLYREPKSFLSLIHPKDIEAYLGIIETYHAQGRSYACEYRIAKKDGTIRWISERGFPTPEFWDGAQLMTGICIDITERKHWEEEVKNQRRILAEAETLAGVGGWVWDIDTDTWAMTENWARLHGTSKTTFTTAELMPYAHPEDRDTIKKALSALVEKGLPYSIQHKIIHQQTGEIRLIKVFGELKSLGEGKPKVVFGAAMDITDQERLREEARVHLEQAMRADRLSSLGEVVAGVAHEINNPNSFITFNLPLVRDIWDFFRPVVRKYADENAGEGLGRIAPNELIQDMDDILSALEKGSDRISKVVSKLRDFALPDVITEPTPVNLNTVVENTLLIFHSKLTVNADIITLDLGADLPAMEGFASELEQVLANLLLNAAHAVASRDNAHIRVATRHVKLCDCMLLEVSDNGPGIDRDDIQRIFDPFFTTRRQDGGTGLGLSITHAIVQKHKGQIKGSSRKEAGTCFSVFLPVRSKGKVPTDTHVFIVDTKNSCIYNVLDQDHLSIKPRLVHSAKNCETVMDHLREHPETDLVMAEISLGNINGWQLLKAIREAYPLLPVVLFSASQQLLETPYKTIRPDGLLKKPLSQAQVIRTVTQLSRVHI